VLIHCGLLAGLDSSSFCSLLYRLRSSHLGFVNRSGTLKFETDIISEEQKIQRLRSLIMQEACESLKIIKQEK